MRQGIVFFSQNVLYDIDKLTTLNFHRSYIWEILKNTINKVISRVSQVQAKLDSLRKTAEEQGGDMTSDGN